MSDGDQREDVVKTTLPTNLDKDVSSNGANDSASCRDALMMGQRRKGLTTIINQLRMHKREPYEGNLQFYSFSCYR